MLKRLSNLSLERLMGSLCIIAGIGVIYIMLVHGIICHEILDYEGRGRFLVGSGIGLLTVKSAENVLSRRNSGES